MLASWSRILWVLTLVNVKANANTKAVEPNNNPAPNTGIEQQQHQRHRQLGDISNACLPNLETLVDYDLLGTPGSILCGAIASPLNPVCRGFVSGTKEVWQDCPLQCNLQSLCPLTMTCDNLPTLPIETSTWGVVTCAAATGGVGCKARVINGTGFAGFVWQHCQQECPIHSFCPPPITCTNPPTQSVEFVIDFLDPLTTDTLQCDQIPEVPARCMQPLAGASGTGLVWHVCQQECFVQCGCPAKSFCKNNPDAEVAFEFAPMGAQCSSLLSSDCSASETQLGGLVSDHCQKQCFDFNACPPPPGYCANAPTDLVTFHDGSSQVTKQCDQLDTLYGLAFACVQTELSSEVTELKVSDYCQQECSEQSGCPPLYGSCSNLPSQMVTFEDAEFNPATTSCDQLETNYGLESACTQPELFSGVAHVSDYCQKECYYYSDCLPPPCGNDPNDIVSFLTEGVEANLPCKDIGTVSGGVGFACVQDEMYKVGQVKDYCPVECFSLSECPPPVPSVEPSMSPTDMPSQKASETPLQVSSDIPSIEASPTPSQVSSDMPSIETSATPSQVSSDIPSIEASATPWQVSSDMPSIEASATPSQVSSGMPSPKASETHLQVSSDIPSIEASPTPSLSSSDVPSLITSDSPVQGSSMAPTNSQSGPWVASCDNSPELAISITAPEAGFVLTKCSSVWNRPARCLLPEESGGSGFVWQKCQKECFGLTGCPFTPGTCQNKGNAKVHMLDGRGVQVLECLDMLNATSVVCMRDEIRLNAKIWQLCQIECFTLSGCPPVSNSPSTTPSSGASGTPSVGSSRAPSSEPSTTPTDNPTIATSMIPSGEPSAAPTGRPSTTPTDDPTIATSMVPSGETSASPTGRPSENPTLAHSWVPSVEATIPPSLASNDISSSPSLTSTESSTVVKTNEPSILENETGPPTSVPTASPLRPGTATPTDAKAPVEASETSMPVEATSDPSPGPMRQPSEQPSLLPSLDPSAGPSTEPSTYPSSIPSEMPSANPSSIPSEMPSQLPVVSKCSTTRCGVDYNDAEAKCGKDCTDWDSEGDPDAACDGKEQCFAGLSECCYEEEQEAREGDNVIDPSIQSSVAPSAVPSNSPSSVPSRQPVTSNPVDFTKETLSPTFAPTPVPIVDKLLQGVKIALLNCRKLTDEEIIIVMGLMMDAFLEYYKAGGEMDKLGRRRLARRRDARNIQTEIEFVSQEVTLDEDGIPTNEITYSHRVVFEDPPGPRPSGIIFDEEASSRANSEPDSDETVDSVPDIDDLTPVEIAVQPFEDFQASFGLASELRDNVDSMKDLQAISKPEVPAQEEADAVVKPNDIQTGNPEKRLDPMTVSVILLAGGAIVVTVAFFLVNHFNIFSTTK